jgi:ubiquinone/menaquinone biosynthesis C-methylase UbiE
VPAGRTVRTWVSPDTIHGGQTDEDRLARQAGVMAAATMAFLAGVGARPGMACLDLGCGDGQVSIQLARLVGPAGRVVGIDTDGDAIAIARRAAAAAGVEVTFVEGDAAIPAERDGFDLAFSRLLLSHPRPAAGQHARGNPLHRIGDA